MFCFVHNNTGLPWAIYHKKKAFLLFVAKTRWNQLYSIKSIFWLVCRKIVSLPALLHLEKVFFQFAAGHPGFLLHFTQNNVFTCVWLSNAVLESSFWEQPLLLFSKPNCTFDALYYWKNVFVCWQLNYIIFEPYIPKTSGAFLCFKYAAFSFIRGETCLGFAVKLGSSQRYCNGKRFSSSFKRVMLVLSHFAQKNVVVCPRLSYDVFSIMLLRTGFSLSSYVNCAFDPLSYRKHVLLCWQWNLMCGAFCYKKTAILFIASEYPFLSLLVATIRFLHLGNKIALLWILYQKKKGFCWKVFFVQEAWI